MFLYCGRLTESPLPHRIHFGFRFSSRGLVKSISTEKGALAKEMTCRNLREACYTCREIEIVE